MSRNRKRLTTKAKWTEGNLEQAMEAVKNGASIRQASKKFAIPFSTLQERIKNKKVTTPTMGRKPVFSTEQELDIANQIKYLASIFYGVSTKELRRFTFEFAERNHIKHNFSATQRLAGKDWLRSFIRRNSTISVRKAEATSLNGLTGFNKDEIAMFYKLLEEVMSKYNFSPSKIYITQMKRASQLFRIQERF